MVNLTNINAHVDWMTRVDETCSVYVSEENCETFSYLDKIVDTFSIDSKNKQTNKQTLMTMLFIDRKKGGFSNTNELV
jgi:hypothetical protein